jgi:hypothetical protein
MTALCRLLTFVHLWAVLHRFEAEAEGRVEGL